MQRMKYWLWGLLAVVACSGIAVAAYYRDRWLPGLSAGATADPVGGAKTPGAGHDDAHAGHDHGDHEHAGHSRAHRDTKSIALSPTALKNIGFQPYTVALGTYERAMTLPAVVVERPGKSQLHVTAPMTGVITKIMATQGAAIAPGSPLFEIRLTHEELVAAQREFLRTAESLDVIESEIKRLNKLSDGLIAGKRVLEQEYEQQKLAASLRADRQALLLHGLSQDQIQSILDTRELLGKLTVSAPVHEDESENCSDEHLFHVQQLPVYQGQQVEAGQALCVLADHCELYLEGRAYEDDAQQLREAVRSGYTLSASLLVGQKRTEVVGGLKLLYLADQIDPATRAFHFYLPLPNQVLLDRETPSGKRFIEWRFKPGQRMELRIPVDRLPERLVLPASAVVDDGANSYVYQQNGDHFDQVPVHVEQRDQQAVVIANDGSLFPGDVVAALGAYQIHLDLRNKSGGAIDPHAGHNH